ncbi:hypothetical protein, partial [Pseudomonas aeruginosa]|uniref:hypothetical protein n=1 Tax=Pseudomonas aeruginosa TaxID=287 RepID=UPI0019CF972D
MLIEAMEPSSQVDLWEVKRRARPLGRPRRKKKIGFFKRQKQKPQVEKMEKKKKNHLKQHEDK